MRAKHGRNIAAALAAVLLSTSVAAAAEVKLISVGGVKGALNKIIADYTKATGNTVNYNRRLAAPGFAKARGRRGVRRGGPIDARHGRLRQARRFKGRDPPQGRARRHRPGGGSGGSAARYRDAGRVQEGADGRKIDCDDRHGDAERQRRPHSGDTRELRGDGYDQAEAHGGRARSRPAADRQRRIEIGLFNISEIRPIVKYAGPVPAPLQQYTDLRCRGDGESVRVRCRRRPAQDDRGYSRASALESCRLEPVH